MTLNKTDRIVISLGKQIVSGKYVPGSALPAEAELCEEFETSRNIVGRRNAPPQAIWRKSSRRSMT